MLCYAMLRYAMLCYELRRGLMDAADGMMRRPWWAVEGILTTVFKLLALLLGEGEGGNDALIPPTLRLSLAIIGLDAALLDDAPPDGDPNGAAELVHLTSPPLSIFRYAMLCDMVCVCYAILLLQLCCMVCYLQRRRRWRARQPAHPNRRRRRDERTELARADAPRSYAMLCYAVLCYAVLCYAVLCYARLG